MCLERKVDLDQFALVIDTNFTMSSKPLREAYKETFFCITLESWHEPTIFYVFNEPVRLTVYISIHTLGQRGLRFDDRQRLSNWKTRFFDSTGAVDLK